MAGTGGGGIVLTNLAGYSMGVDQDVDASINVQKVTCKASATKKEVLDRVGVTVGIAYSAFRQEYSVSGYVKGTTGIMAETIGGLVTLAALNALGGIATGGACILDTITVDQQTGELTKMDATLTYFPDIPSTATSVVIPAATIVP